MGFGRIKSFSSDKNDAALVGFSGIFRNGPRPGHNDLVRERERCLDLVVFLVEKSLSTVVASGDGLIKGSVNWMRGGHGMT